MAFRRDVIEAMAVQAVKGRDKVTIPGVIATVQAKLADRFDVTKTVRVLCFACLGASCQACLPVSIAFACLFMGHGVSALRSGLRCAGH
jgi:hypothetical protein